jgi:hypothetical protein
MHVRSICILKRGGESPFTLLLRFLLYKVVFCCSMEGLLLFIFKILGINFRESSSVPFTTYLELNRKLKPVLSNIQICSRKEVLEVICLITEQY